MKTLRTPATQSIILALTLTFSSLLKAGNSLDGLFAALFIAADSYQEDTCLSASDDESSCQEEEIASTAVYPENLKDRLCCFESRPREKREQPIGPESIARSPSKLAEKLEAARASYRSDPKLRLKEERQQALMSQQARLEEWLLSRGPLQQIPEDPDSD